MKSVLALFVALGLPASSAFAQTTFMINTPSDVTVCQPVLISWAGGDPPYSVSILPGGQTSASPLFTFPDTNATEVSWLVDVAAGTSLGLNARDATGAVVQSAPFTTIAGTSTSCVGVTTSFNFGSTAAGGATSAGSSPTAASATTPAATAESSNTSANSPANSPSANSPSANSPSANSPSTSAGSNTGTATGTGTTSSASATASNAASRVTGQVAAAGIIGAAMVALLG